MTRFYLAVYRVSQAAAVVAATAIVLMTALIAVEIALRFFFSTSTFVQDEFVGYGLSICIVWSLGYTLEHGNMIRVNLLITRLSPRNRALLTALGAGLTLALVLGLAWMFWLRTERAFGRGTVSASSAEVPTWIPEGLMLVGLLLFALQLAAHGARHLTGHPSPAPQDPNDHQE
jgi:TRAP-type C4-dicarboxylate transport system permease small subunit